ncbi:MAG: DUF4145 domain-containing protein [Crocinitomicaceae bacterium]|nr:DUF4145 domain-containing protein [Crocinitomicaceae bacterium]MBK8928029.1 DUF4145 domain-containing protein [Crocinitomicaceae bacterium]
MEIMIDIKTDTGSARLNDLPGNCPHCHKAIQPIPVFGHVNYVNQGVEVNFVCPNLKCNSSFLAFYGDSGHGDVYFEKIIIPKRSMPKDFSETINQISPNFVIIYNQALEAEMVGLCEICGVGFRKALEHLIKDYLIILYPEQESQVKKMLLGRCIDELVNDTRIKSVAKRAVWIGNDEAHYERKWQNKDLRDLKKLIDLTAHWIDMESLTQEIIHDMPE